MSRHPARPPGLSAGSIQARLTWLAAAAIVPLLLLFAGVAYLDYRAERARAGASQLEIARGLAATVERELRGATAALQALALSPRLQVGDLAGFRELAVRFIAIEPAGSALVLLDRNGVHLVNTRVPAGTPPAHRAQAVNDALTTPIFATGRPMVSNLFKRTLGADLIVTADVPVFHDGQVAYDLSLVLPPSRFTDILAGQDLPAGTVSSIFDRNGIHVARLPDDDRYRGTPATPVLMAPLLRQSDGVVASTAMEGTPVFSAFSRTMPSGWSVTVSVPEATLRAPLLRSLLLAGGAGVSGLLFSAAVAAAMAQRILRPIQALARFAADPAGDRSMQTGVRELDAVAAALRHSLADRQAAMDALQGLNDDLEDRVQLETASRVKAQEQLAQARRVEALGQLAGGIAHDFNNVLQAIGGGLSLIQRRSTDPEIDRLATAAGSAAARGAAITGRLLTFARRGSLAARPVPTRALLDSLRDILALPLGPGITLRLEALVTLPDLLADRAQLETVLVNLAVNARDAMPGGGVLTLSAAAEIATATHPARLAPGAYIRLTLTDTGSGMPPDVLARASDPFFTTKPTGQGTGLGLAMARGFAEQSGGGLLIVSEPGAGTAIMLWLPQAVAAHAAPDAAAVPAGLEGGTVPRVIMVDDDAMVRNVLASELEANGFHVVTAGNGLAALALLDSGQQADLLITDFAMPGMGGLTLIGQMRRRRATLPAILLTGYVEMGADAALQAVPDPLTTLLRKPISGEELVRQAMSRLRP